jgi:Subtilase family
LRLAVNLLRSGALRQVGLVAMFTSNMLKSKENISSRRATSLSLPAILCSALLFIPLVLATPPAHAQLVFGGSLNDFVEEATEDAAEEQVEEQVQEQVQEQIQDQIEERVLVFGAEAIEDSVQDQVEDGLQDAIEDEVEQDITDNIEITLEGNIEDEIEQDVEETIESIVEESVEGSVEERIEDNIAESISEGVEESLEVAVEEELAASVEADVESSVEENIEATAEAEVESAVEIQVAAAVEDRIEDGIDDILERIEIDEDRIHKDQWLVMAAPEVFEELADEGYLFETVTELPGLGLRLAEVAAPSSFDITSVRQGVIDIVGSDRAEVDLNHIYTAGDQLAEQSGDGMMPRNAIEFPADTESMALRIGMIDSQVDVTHPALQDARIESRAFTSAGAEIPKFHGTAIASIIAGNGAEYVGIAPNSEVYAAGVFEQDAERGEIASTVSLVRALDWLISSGVDVINISLAGPPNRLLESALQKASESKVTILAAAGNGGPVAAPMYPAAYASVVAVTAVDSRGQVFRLANRGDYLDIAAPGVALRHAKSGGGYASSSGTSFAVPFAATAIARLRQLQPGDDALELLCRTAEDLGPPGRDSIYGFGLLRPASS